MSPRKPWSVAARERAIVIGGLAAVILYVIWMGWPYLKAIVVRDAAVTSWLTVAVSPTAGYTSNVLYPGQRTGRDGRMATIVDPRADATAVAKARADVARADAQFAAAEVQCNALRDALDRRVQHADEFRSMFVHDLDAATAGAAKGLESERLRLELARADESRIASLASEGVVATSAVDAAHAKVAELERDIALHQSSVERSSERHRAAADGIFFLENGSDANAVFQGLADARVRLVEATTTLEERRADRDAARTVLAAAEGAFEKARSLDIIVPPDAMVWSLLSGPGAPVQPGTPVASWVDCRVMLVDVAVADVETTLLRPGAPADVVIEGERKTRRGVVLLERGSAGTLGASDLAAVAKGRRPGLGQVIVRLNPAADDVRVCPMGEAAFVDFPNVGVFDLMRARLRW